MNSKCVVVFMILTVVCAGCHTTDQFKAQTGDSNVRRLRNLTLSFSEPEIRSRVWRGNGGQEFRLLNWSTVTVKGRELILAKYGVAATGAICCIDFYEPIPPGDRPIHPDELWLILLGHDSGVTQVTDVKLSESGGRVFFDVIRRTFPSQGNKRKEFRYTLEYFDDFRMAATTSRAISEIPDTDP